ncbi:MAG: DUF4276 family protein [Deltaproteobacteria bacterium]|nr:DUF4276 family protein [Deltaproteobacteria bacterium]
MGEGTTEFGPDENQAIPTERARDGVGQVLIRRLLGDDRRALVLKSFRHSGLGKEPSGRAFGNVDDETAKARAAAKEARRQRCDAVVFLRDADSLGDSRREKIEAGFANSFVPFVIGVPIETTESWLLADPGAFERALGARHSQRVDKPESLWGDRYSEGSLHPKRVWKRACADIRRGHGRETATAVAEQLDLEEVKRRCPSSFATFAAALERAIPQFECVVAAERAHGIGYEGERPWPHLSADRQHFENVTLRAAAGKRNAIIMGRRTWDAMHGNPLADRFNIVIGRDAAALPAGVRGAASLDQALLLAGGSEPIDKVFVVGGRQLYAEAFEHLRCVGLHYTRVDFPFECDAFIPDPSQRFERDLTISPLHHSEAGFDYSIEYWRRART